MGRKIRLVLILAVFSMGAIAGSPDGALCSSSHSAVNNINKFNIDRIEGNNFAVNTDEGSDDFNLPVLRACWASTARTDSWTLKERPGFLRLKGESASAEAIIRGGNAFSQKIGFNSTGEAVCHLELTNLSVNGESGMYFLSKQTINRIGITRVPEGFRLEVLIQGQKFTSPTFTQASVVVKFRFDAIQGGFEYSFDGLEYQVLGIRFKMNQAVSQGETIGLYFSDQQETGSVDIDWFHFSQEISSSVKFAQSTSVLTTNDL